jgi:crotonobetainyl-CoA:carnitine CoA-transferase CaiB-like acyl-CoA transferase
MRLSKTPTSERHAPPSLGEHTEEVLGELLGLGQQDVSTLRDEGII